MTTRIKNFLAKESQIFQYLGWLEERIDGLRSEVSKLMYAGPEGPYCSDPRAEDRNRELLAKAEELSALLLDRAIRRRYLLKVSERRKAAEAEERAAA